MGLVERRPNKGAMVRDFSVEEVEDVYEMYALLQQEAASRVPMPADESFIKRLEAINAELGDAVDRGELERVCTLNNDFHREIHRACDNQCLADLIERLWIQTLGMRCYAIGDPELLNRTCKEHAEMISHLRMGNREAFKRLCVDHLSPSLEAYKRAHGGWSINRKAV
jgi:DNA-binding GntR family transcriptional regulator